MSLFQIGTWANAPQTTPSQWRFLRRRLWGPLALAGSNFLGNSGVKSGWPSSGQAERHLHRCSSSLEDLPPSRLSRQSHLKASKRPAGVWRTFPATVWRRERSYRLEELGLCLLEHQEMSGVRYFDQFLLLARQLAQ